VGETCSCVYIVCYYYLASLVFVVAVFLVCYCFSFTLSGKIGKNGFCYFYKNFYNRNVNQLPIICTQTIICTQRNNNNTNTNKC